MLKNTAPSATTNSLHKARKLRRAMTPPEVRLWQALRTRPAGLKFRRQHASGPFVCDFLCADARLVIEVDGGAHDTGARPARDQARDEWFAARGLSTLRLPAALVMRDLDAAVRHIVYEARARLPFHHPAAPGGPPSPRQARGGIACHPPA